MVVSKKTTILSFGYWFSAYSLGLLVHPYKTVRSLVRERVYLRLIWFPMVFWVLSWVIVLVVLRLIEVVFALVGFLTPQWLIFVSGFGFWWMSVFLLLWQVRAVLLELAI